ncbi:hypothetical protein IID10_14540, partial [candidate division KSB1 bacterium]|nr:hypothetical protein [candidate division KSB1 bacterium]
LASFEGWSDSVRSALIWLGRADPVVTMEQARDEDPHLAALHEMLTAWAEALGTGPATRRTAADLLTLIEERETRLAGDGDAHEGYEREWRYPALRNAVLAAAASRGRPEVRTLGRWLVRHRGRIAGGLRFAGETDKHGHGWKGMVEKLTQKRKRFLPEDLPYINGKRSMGKYLIILSSFKMTAWAMK